MSDIDRLSVLADSEVLSGVDPDILMEAVDGTSIVLTPSGSDLVKQGSDGDQVYVLISGSLEIVHTTRKGEVGVATLSEPGSIVGEVAILAGGVRTASARAAQDVVALSIPRTNFERLLDRDPQLFARLASEALQRIEETELNVFLARTFGGDDPDFLAELVSEVAWTRYRGGEVIMREGEEADAAYIVVSGRTVVTRLDVHGQSERLAELGRGEIVGELGLLDGGYRHATVTAMRDSVLVRIPRALFDRLIDRNPRQVVEAARRMVRRAMSPTRPLAGGLVISIAVTAPDERRQAALLVKSLSQHGSTEHLWPELVDTFVARPGAATAAPGDPTELRVVNLIHELELRNAYLVLDSGVDITEWTRRAFRQADRAVVIASGVLDGDELERVTTIFRETSAHSERILVLLHPPEFAVPAGCSNLRILTGADQVVNVRRGSTADLDRLGRILAGQAYGVVLGGGGARGFAHIGVYRALTELGVPIDWVGGSSIGAVFAAFIAKGIPPDELATITPRLFKGVLDYTIPMVSLVKGARITSRLDSLFGGMEIEDLWTGFFCVSTNLTRSRPLIHRQGPLPAAIRASLAIPGVIPPVPLGDDLLVDGGVLDNVPVGVMRALLPTGTVIAVDLAPPLGPGARSDFGLSVSGWSAVMNKTGGKKRAYPGLAAVLLRSMITGSSAQREQKIAAADFYLDLDLRGVGMLEFDVVEPVVEAGYKAAMSRLGTWFAAQPGNSIQATHKTDSGGETTDYRA